MNVWSWDRARAVTAPCSCAEFDSVSTRLFFRDLDGLPCGVAPQIHRSTCLKSNTSTLPFDVPTHTRPLVAITVGSPCSISASARALFVEKIWELITFNGVHLNASLGSGFSPFVFANSERMEDRLECVE